MYETKEYFYGTGRRKHSVARVRVYNGTGKFIVNGRELDNYFGLDTLKLLARSPLVLTGTEGPVRHRCQRCWRRLLRPGRRYPPWSVPRSAAVQPRAAHHPEEGWLPDPRSSYEGT